MIGYRENAVLYDLEDVKIQTIKVMSSSKLNTTGSFMGGGKANTSQTLELATQSKLSPLVIPYKSRCVYNGKSYLLVSTFEHSINPIKGAVKAKIETILALQ